MSTNTVALVTLSLATKDVGSSGVPYPIEHALVYYLLHNKVNFDYTFTFPYLYPIDDIKKEKWAKDFSSNIIEYPHSFELASKIESLCSMRILDQRRHSPLFILAGPLAIKKRETYIERFEEVGGIKYSELKSTVKDILDNPKNMLDDCYKYYINEICGKSKD
jgi:hypothetical protein